MKRFLMTTYFCVIFSIHMLTTYATILLWFNSSWHVITTVIAIIIGLIQSAIWERWEIMDNEMRIQEITKPIKVVLPKREDGLKKFQKEYMKKNYPETRKEL